MATTRRPALVPTRSRASGRIRLRLSAVVAVVLVAVALAGLAYGIARKTSLFAVQTFDVTGAGEEIEAQVDAALARFRGKSLVGLDPEAVARAAESVPAIRTAEVERDFPRTLHVAVTTEKPVAVVRQADAAWLVAASGKVLRAVATGDVDDLPRVWLPAESKQLELARTLPPAGGGLAVEALALVPAGFPVKVLSARGGDGDLTLVLPGKTELRLGEAADVQLKLAVAATVLSQLSPEERGRLAYLDLSLPARPVGADKSQVEA